MPVSSKFTYFSSSNSYVEPYSSTVGGGELITEFNQRAQLNVIGWKSIKWKGDAAQTYVSKMSGCKTPSDLALSITNSRLRIAPGEALVAGYYVNLREELIIPGVSIIDTDDMGSNRPDNYKKTKFVKLEATCTQPTNNPYDERLIPPVNSNYEAISIICDDTLPQMNQLLLGTISRNVNGLFTVENDVNRSRFIDISHITGADNYDRLVEAPPAGDSSIYGIKYGETDGSGNVTHRKNINEWTWLAYSSVLGRYLRNMARVPDDAGAPGGGTGSTSLKMLGSIVGYTTAGSTPAAFPSGTNPSNNKLIKLMPENNGEKTPYLAYRVLKDGQSAPDCYDEEYVPLPFANYSGRPISDTDPTVHGKTSGMITAEDLYHLDSLWQVNGDNEKYLKRQFGPFTTTQMAQNFINDHPGTTQGGYFRGGDYFWVLNDELSLGVELGTASGSYQATTQGNVKVLADPKQINVTITGSDSFMGNFTGELTLNNGGSQVGVYDAEGQMTASSSEWSVDGSATLDAIDAIGSVAGTGQGSVSLHLNEFNQNVSTRYVYIPNDPSWITDDYPDTPVLECSDSATAALGKWYQQACMRGFACPATYEYFGFLRPGSNSTGTEGIGSVINDGTNHLRLSDVSLEMLQNGGWRVVENASPLEVTVDTAESIFNSIAGTKFVGGLTITLRGEGWDAGSVTPLHKLRGDITLDISNATGAEGVAALLTCEDVDALTLVVGNSTEKVNTTGCVVTPHNFNSIYRWLNTQFTSGSNTATFDNPWVTMDKVFSSSYTNSVQSRIVSVTRGEYALQSAEMDIWIKFQSWTEPHEENDFQRVSKKKLKFPPLLLVLDDNNNIVERQTIPENLNAKVSGTGGVHLTYDTSTGEYVPTGNWITTVNWEHQTELSVNARLLSPTSDAITEIHDFRFRALVQFTRADDMVEKSISYSAVYPE